MTANTKSQEWNDNLVKAIAIIDEKGVTCGDGSVALWERDWTHLRSLLLETLDQIKKEVETTDR